MDGIALWKRRPKWKREPHRRPTEGEGAEKPLMMGQSPVDGTGEPHERADPWMGALLSDPQVPPPHPSPPPNPLGLDRVSQPPYPGQGPGSVSPHTPHVRPQLVSTGDTNKKQSTLLCPHAIPGGTAHAPRHPRYKECTNTHSNLHGMGNKISLKTQLLSQE